MSQHLTKLSYQHRRCPANVVVPKKPTLNVTKGDGSVSFTVTDDNTNGATVTKRNIYYSNGTTSKVFDAGSNQTGTITGLVNGTEYSFQATSINSVGESEKSDVVKATPSA